MATQHSIEKAAQAWCKPNTSHLDMIPELVEAFAEILDEIWGKPWLGNATTGEMLNEIASRVNLNYKTVGGEELMAQFKRQDKTLLERIYPQLIIDKCGKPIKEDDGSGARDSVYTVGYCNLNKDHRGSCNFTYELNTTAFHDCNLPDCPFCTVKTQDGAKVKPGDHVWHPNWSHNLIVLSNGKTALYFPDVVMPLSECYAKKENMPKLRSNTYQKIGIEQDEEFIKACQEFSGLNKDEVFESKKGYKFLDVSMI